MPNLLGFNPIQYVGFVFIFTRIIGLFLTAPLLGNNNIPMQVKVAFAFIISLIFFPLLSAPRLAANPDGLEIILLLLGELGIGLMMGLSAQMLLAAVELAGEVVGFQMGIGMANVFDPSTASQVALLGQIKVVFALLLLVAMDGHHLFIKGLATSYGLVQPGAFALDAFQYEKLLSMSGNIFMLGLTIGAPLIVALLAANISIGLIARTVPQMNVFIVGIPFTIALGMLLMALGFPFFIAAVSGLHDQMQEIILGGLKNG